LHAAHQSRFLAILQGTVALASFAAFDCVSKEMIRERGESIFEVDGVVKHHHNDVHVPSHRARRYLLGLARRSWRLPRIVQPAFFEPINVLSRQFEYRLRRERITHELP